MISTWKFPSVKINYSLTSRGCVWVLGHSCSFLRGSAVIPGKPGNFLPKGLTLMALEKFKIQKFWARSSFLLLWP